MLADAIAMHQVNLNLLERAHGPQHPLVLTARNNLATSLTAAGRHQAAIAQLELALAARRLCWAPITATRCGRGSTWPTSTSP